MRKGEVLVAHIPDSLAFTPTPSPSLEASSVDLRGLGGLRAQPIKRAPQGLGVSRIFISSATSLSASITYSQGLAVAASRFAPGDGQEATVPVRSTVGPDPERLSIHRRRELEWLRTHGDVLQACEGEWVVLEGETLICHGRDALAVVGEARRRGIRVPYVFFVEPRERGVAQLGL